MSNIEEDSSVSSLDLSLGLNPTEPNMYENVNNGNDQARANSDVLTEEGLPEKSPSTVSDETNRPECAEGPPKNIDSSGMMIESMCGPLQESRPSPEYNPILTNYEPAWPFLPESRSSPEYNPLLPNEPTWPFLPESRSSPEYNPILPNEPAWPFLQGLRSSPEYNPILPNGSNCFFWHESRSSPEYNPQALKRSRVPIIGEENTEEHASKYPKLNEAMNSQAASPRALKNTMYDPMYEEMGLPIDPHIRMFLLKKNKNGW